MNARVHKNTLPPLYRSENLAVLGKNRTFVAWKRTRSKNEHTESPLNKGMLQNYNFSANPFRFGAEKVCDDG